MDTIAMIKKAIIDNKIISFFQPIINNRTGQVEKYESLVRIIDDDNEVLVPSFFLDTVKKGEYYHQITNIIIENSFKQLRACDKEISINLSVFDIEEERTIQNILDLLVKHKVYAHRIIFELLEDASIKDLSKMKEFIYNVRAYGVQIAIDDFGAGYSNFERILDCRPDILKIDGSLIKNIDTDQQSRDIVESIHTFASKHQIKTVAEYVSNEKIQQIVFEIGIDYSQGFYFGKPELLEFMIEVPQ